MGRPRKNNPATPVDIKQKPLISVNRAVLTALVQPIYNDALFFQPHPDEMDVVIEMIEKELAETVSSIVSAKFINSAHNAYVKKRQEAKGKPTDPVPPAS